MPLLFVLGVLLVVGLAFQGTASSGEGAKVLAFETMTPVVAPFTAPTTLVRGIRGGGVPWRLTAAEGKLRADGRLQIEVEGLVIAASGQNPSLTFRGAVSCLTTADPTNGTTAFTDEFPATTSGDSEIDGDVTLPSPCFAPVVFVTNGAGNRWFAVTGVG